MNTQLMTAGLPSNAVGRRDLSPIETVFVMADAQQVKAY